MMKKKCPTTKTPQKGNGKKRQKWERGDRSERREAFPEEKRERIAVRETHNLAVADRKKKGKKRCRAHTAVEHGVVPRRKGLS